MGYAQGEDPEKEQELQEKVWKKKLKSTPPLDLKRVSDEYNQLKRTKGKLNSEIRQIATQLDTKDAQARNLRMQIDSIRAERGGKTMDMDANETDITEKESHCKGTVFKVQIGVKQQIDGSFREDGKRYRIEEDTDGRLVYSLGCFRERDQAMTFQDQIKTMKVSDVYVVLYKNGERSDMKEVQETNEETVESEETSEDDAGDDW